MMLFFAFSKNAKHDVNLVHNQCANHWAIPFFIHAGVWKANSLGVCQKHFPRESGTKIVFPRWSGQVFQRGHT